MAATRYLMSSHAKSVSLVGCLITLMFLPGRAADDTRPLESTYEDRKASRDGIGKIYFGREIAQVMGHQGAAWLERAEREEEERTDLLLKELKLKSGDVVADVGAGSG